MIRKIMNSNEIILRSGRIEDILSKYEDWFPQKTDYDGYRNHCVRMLNVALALSNNEPDRQEKLEIAIAFHDLTIFPSRTMNYLETAVKLASDYLKSIDQTTWEEEVSLMIKKHHQFRKYTGPHANLVNALRMADWTDVSLGQLRYGLPSAWIKSLHHALPLYSFPRTILSIIFMYGLRNPLRPLPNFRG